MVSSSENTLIQNIKLSSIGPSNVTGTDVTHEPNAMDLAMKLHYIFGVYIFRSHAVLGLSVMNIKESMFFWLNQYYVTCGRFRRSESGRPYLKCNDCGARFVEAQCDKSVDEWLEMRDCSLDKLLVYHQPIGPELSFSPPLYIQLSNSQIISCVEANIPIKDANLEQLAAIMVNEGVDERGEIEEAMERENGVGDFIVYGANLTFVNMEEADVYGLELKADFVSFCIQGIGDEGSVVVMPEAKDLDKDVGKLGRFVTITLPENEIVKLKPEFKKNDLLLEINLE
ncbi:hypothetical protein Pint_25503 [Pistacia integerrima]|uniref:Uncharacterized protein n=1 Tax=Pistacia integerrima TaxID=434235 RepID=A0ACC0YEV2_9ROSI|nr:hypothetical protein Pint_25503 [Pistacia integerrima]